MDLLIKTKPSKFIDFFKLLGIAYGGSIIFSLIAKATNQLIVNNFGIDAFAQYTERMNSTKVVYGWGILLLYIK